MRRAGRTDNNHSAIVGAFRACGAQVLSLASVGQGCPDLLVAHRGRLMLVEVKNGAKSPSRRALTDDQVEFHKRWPVTLVDSVENAIAVLA